MDAWTSILKFIQQQKFPYLFFGLICLGGYILMPLNIGLYEKILLWILIWQILSLCFIKICPIIGMLCKALWSPIGVYITTKYLSDDEKVLLARFKDNYIKKIGIKEDTKEEHLAIELGRKSILINSTATLYSPAPIEFSLTNLGQKVLKKLGYRK